MTISVVQGHNGWQFIRWSGNGTVRAALFSGIGVKVYACGLYVDPAAARAAVGDQFVGREPADVCKDQSLYSAINSSADVEKTVRLTFARDIDSAKIVNALSGTDELETLSPRHHPRSNPRFLSQMPSYDAASVF